MSNTKVSIHIDDKHYESPNPTTGAALYVLGQVDAEKYELHEEVKGPGEDVLINNNAEEIEVKNGTHFYSAKKNLSSGVK